MTTHIPESLSFPDDDRIARAVEAGTVDFWSRIVDYFPEVTTGDADPLQVVRLEQALVAAVKEHLHANSPYCNVDLYDDEPVRFDPASPFYLDGAAVSLINALHAAGHRAPYSAVFHPEETVGGSHRQQPVPAKPRGPMMWPISQHHLRVVLNRAAEPNPATGHADVRLAFDAHSSFTDQLRDDPAAPDWVRAWSGPFWVEVRDADNQTVEPWIAVPEIPA